jgi:hypothetical protein
MSFEIRLKRYKSKRAKNLKKSISKIVQSRVYVPPNKMTLHMTQKKTMHSILKRMQDNPDNFVKATFSSFLHVQGADTPERIHIRPVLIRDKIQYQIEYCYKTRGIVKNYTHDEIVQIVLDLEQHFKQGNLVFKEEEFFITKIHDEYKIKRKIIEKPHPLDLSHNIKKNYIIEEGKPCPFLEKLNIMNKDGAVRVSMRDKFIQINQFIEIIRSLIKDIPRTEPIHVVDFGCGKAYLTFALYYYLTVIEKRSATIEGIDLKTEVLEECRKVADMLGYTELTFSREPIQEYQSKKNVSLVVALHACDIASDYALFQAIALGAKAIAVAPCCQHEIRSKIKPDVLPVILQHGILKEQLCSIITDAMRAELLELSGYKTDIVEFVDVTHTPKNILIRAVKRDRSDEEHLKKLRERYEGFVRQFGVEPTLAKLIIGQKNLNY